MLRPGKAPCQASEHRAQRCKCSRLRATTNSPKYGGCHGEYVEKPDEIRLALERAKAAVSAGKAAVVNIITESADPFPNGPL
jgi:thiamine pyrophosphate-dependent acetolactate synthase large subunit-like protein